MSVTVCHIDINTGYKKLTKAVKRLKISQKYICIQDALALYLWSHGLSWSLADGYGNGNQCCPIGPCGSGKDFTLPYNSIHSK